MLLVKQSGGLCGNGCHCGHESCMSLQAQRWCKHWFTGQWIFCGFVSELSIQAALVSALDGVAYFHLCGLLYLTHCENDELIAFTRCDVVFYVAGATSSGTDISFAEMQERFCHMESFGLFNMLPDYNPGGISTVSCCVDVLWNTLPLIFNDILYSRNICFGWFDLYRTFVMMRVAYHVALHDFEVENLRILFS